MGFLFPLFLLAGLAIIIPLVIHLFNLRKYKRVDFPDTRFLRDIQLSTKRQAKVQNVWLMLTRMAFILALVIAFAQPFFSSNTKNDKATVSAIYIDNSYSMGLASGQQSLLQQAKQKVHTLLQQANANGKFLILSNDKASATRPLMRDEALVALEQIQPTAKPANLKRIVQSVAAAQSNERSEQWNLYLFTDLQSDAFVTNEKINKPANAEVYFYTMRESGVGNVYIDTAYFLSPNLDTRQPNDLVVRLRQSGDKEQDEVNLKVAVNGQVRAVSTLSFASDSVAIDTMALQLDGNGWQQITASLQDHPLSFDDTFRIAARTAPNLSILVLGDGALNPYLQAAFRTYDGFTVTQQSLAGGVTDDWNKYSLIVLQNVTNISPTLSSSIKKALDNGQNILLFPGLTDNPEMLNASLKQWGELSLAKLDTAKQQVVSIQQAHPLLLDLFEKMPDNVQLPLTTKRYPIDAGLTANQQSLMSFRDGKPFLAQYSLGNGRLYLCASPLDDRSSNFAVSYYFVPVLYKMAVQSGGNSMYAVSIGSNQPVWLPAIANDSRKVFHLNSENFDAIPPQRPSGSGVEVFSGGVVSQAGFYKLNSEASKDTILIAMNSNRLESVLKYASKSEVEGLLAPMDVNWLDNDSVAKAGWDQGRKPFPIWKVAIIIGLLLLGLETWLMLKKPKLNTSTATV